MDHSNVVPTAVSNSKIAERLLAHARLCRQIAGQSWNETTAAKLEELAEECDRAAADVAHLGSTEAVSQRPH